MTNYNETAKKIIQAIGGEKNISSVAHCATRLRFVLKDESLIDKSNLENIDIVKGTISASGQFQIILGSGIVNQIYSVTTKVLNFDPEATQIDENTIDEKKVRFLQRFVKLLSDIFIPFIPAIVAGGLLMGITNLLKAKGLFMEGQSIIEAYPNFSGFAAMIDVFANAPFLFLPILIGFSASKRFGGNPYLGAALSMIMVHPSLLAAGQVGRAGVTIPTWDIFGLSVNAVGYQGTILPILAVSWIIANIEKKLHKITPSWLDNLTTPLLSILITAFVTFTLIGPALRSAGDGLAYGLSWLYNFLGPFGGLIFGVLYAPITVTGMHNSFIAVQTQLLASIETTGGTFINPIASMNNIAQGAATLAVLIITKNQKIKSLASASGISALLGITEPAMFGVTLKVRYPFYAAIIATGISGAFIAATKTLAIGLGTAGIPGIVLIAPGSWGNFAIGGTIAFSISFILTFIFSKKFGESAAG